MGDEGRLVSWRGSLGGDEKGGAMLWGVDRASLALGPGGALLGPCGPLGALAESHHLLNLSPHCLAHLWGHRVMVHLCSRGWDRRSRGGGNRNLGGCLSSFRAALWRAS